MDEHIKKLKYELERRLEFQKSESKILNSQEIGKTDENLERKLKENFNELKLAIDTWKKEVF